MSVRSFQVVWFVVSVGAVACGSSKKTPEAQPAPSTTSTDSGSPPPAPPECKNPSDVMLYGTTPTGYVNCEGGGLHRKEAVDCPSKLPRTTKCGFDPVGDAAATGDCRSDTECTTKPNGLCTTSARSAFCFCDYGCVKDSDCGDGFVCQCADPVGKCVAATCHTDADCGGLLCLRSLDPNCGFVFACQEPTDPCTVNGDCPAGATACMVKDGNRSCQPVTSCN